MGRTSADHRWHCLREDGSDFPGDEHPAMVVLRSGRPVLDTLMGGSPPRKAGNVGFWLMPFLSSAPVKPPPIASTAFADITERKQAEQALRESEQHYRTLVETAPDAAHVITADGTLASLNPAFERISGWPRTDWIGKPFLQLVHPDDQALAMETFQQVLRGETPPVYRLRILSKTGDYLLGEFTSTPYIEQGRIVGELGHHPRHFVTRGARGGRSGAVRPAHAPAGRRTLAPGAGTPRYHGAGTGRDQLEHRGDAGADHGTERRNADDSGGHGTVDRQVRQRTPHHDLSAAPAGAGSAGPGRHGARLRGWLCAAQRDPGGSRNLRRVGPTVTRTRAGPVPGCCRRAWPTSCMHPGKQPDRVRSASLFLYLTDEVRLEVQDRGHGMKLAGDLAAQVFRR